MSDTVIGRDFKFGSLRSLREEDCEGMLEWMADPDVSRLFRVDFASADKNSVLSFIRSTWSDEKSMHLAISGLDGEYLGTISLKHLDFGNCSAEYAIVLRSKAHGTGAALRATREMLDLAFGRIGLHRVYLSVRASNVRAIRFYEKVGFMREGVAREAITRVSGESYEDLFWYAMLVGERA